MYNTVILLLGIKAIVFRFTVEKGYLHFMGKNSNFGERKNLILERK